MAPLKSHLFWSICNMQNTNCFFKNRSRTRTFGQASGGDRVRRALYDGRDDEEALVSPCVGVATDVSDTDGSAKAAGSAATPLVSALPSRRRLPCSKRRCFGERTERANEGELLLWEKSPPPLAEAALRLRLRRTCGDEVRCCCRVTTKN